MVNNSPLSQLTVLVSCYNKNRFIANFLSQAIELLNLGAEIVVIDDGSKDGSKELLEKFAEKGVPGWRLFTQENKGSAATRNKLLSLATREWVLFLDIDDSIESNNVVSAISESKSNNCDLIVGSYKISPLGTLGPIPKHVDTPTIVEFSSIRHEVRKCMGYWRYIYRRDFVKSNLLHFSPTHAELKGKPFILDDAFWMVSLMSAKCKILVLPETQIIYNWHVENPTKESLQRYRSQQALLPIASNIFLDSKPGVYWQFHDYQLEGLLSIIKDSSRELPIDLYLKSEIERIKFCFRLIKLSKGKYSYEVFLLLTKSLIRSIFNSSRVEK